MDAALAHVADSVSAYLFEHDEGDDCGGGEQGRDEDHDDADRDARIQARERGDPAAEGKNRVTSARLPSTLATQAPICPVRG